MNYIIELYDTALKETISKLKNAERLVRVKDSALNCKTSEFKAALNCKTSEFRAESTTRREEGPEGEVHGEVWRAEGQIQDCWREDQSS